MLVRRKYNFYFSASHKRHLIEVARCDYVFSPDGRYHPRLIQLDSEETVEYTQSALAPGELSADLKANFPDYVYLGRGEALAYEGPRWQDRRRSSEDPVEEDLFAATCDRCKRARPDCLIVPYDLPRQTSLLSSHVKKLEDVIVPSATMCRE